MKTSDQTLFSSVSFRHSLLLRLPDHQTSVLCQAWTCSHITRGGSAQKLTSSLPTENLLGQFRKKKIKKAIKSKTNQLASNILLGLSKRRKSRVWPGSSSVWHSVTFGHRPSCSFRWQFEGRRRTRRWLCATVPVVSMKTTKKKSRYIYCAKCFRWSHTLCAGVEEDFVCEPARG